MVDNVGARDGVGARGADGAASGGGVASATTAPFGGDSGGRGGARPLGR